MTPDLSRCVFHTRTPGNADADRLEPLSALRATDPAAYARALAKYGDTPERRRLPGTRIPGLGVRWTDVVFLSPVRPHAIWTAWRELGGVELPAQEFWAIPVDEIGEAVVLDRGITSTGEPIDASEVTRLDPASYRSATGTTPGNADWIRELSARGRRGAWFHRTPHVLTASPVPLEGAAAAAS